MSSDSNTLTPTELHALQSLLAAVKSGRDEEARFWVDRPALLSALAKMRAQAEAKRKEAS